MTPATAWAGPDASTDADNAASSSRADSSPRNRVSARSDADATAPGNRARGARGAAEAAVEASEASDAGADIAPRRSARKAADIVPSAAAAAPAEATNDSPAPVAEETSLVDAPVVPDEAAESPAPVITTLVQSEPRTLVAPKLSALLPVRPAIAKPAPGSVFASVADRITTAVNNAIARIVDSLANRSPFAPAVEGPANWLLLAFSRRQIQPAGAADNVTQGTTATPVMVLDGYDVVPTSKLDAVSFYGPFTTWPGFSGVQGVQDFDLVDPETGETVGSFRAHVRSDGYTSTKVFQVTEVLSGTVGTGPGLTPPVGSIMSVSGDGVTRGTVYTDMPTANGYVLDYYRITRFGERRLFTAYHAAETLTDYQSVNQAVVLTDGFYIAPTVPSTETFLTVTGMPPLFTAVQGTQDYSVWDQSTNVPVGNFKALVTTTSDFFGLDTKMIVVTDTGEQTNVGTGAGEVPPVGTVYNVIYFNRNTYILYQSSPTPDGDYVATTLVTPLFNIPLRIGNLDASSPPPLKPLELSSGASLVPTNSGPVVGGNGLPPREMISQGNQQFDVLDADGNKIGSVDAYLTRQWDWVGTTQEQILVIDVTEGTPTDANGVPPVGTVYNTRMVGSTGFGDFYSSAPTATGVVTEHYLITPFGNLPWPGLADSAVNPADVNFFNPFATRVLSAPIGL